MKKTSKILSIIVTVLMIVSIATNVFAAPANPNTYTGTATTQFNNIGNRIIGAVQSIGSIASVIVLVIIGIKYMMGSAEEKAEYKKTMIPYVIGAVLVFAASNIAGFIFGFAGEIV